MFIEGTWVQNPKLIKDQVVSFFSARFLREELIAPFSDLDLREAVWSCSGDKCPGPDGFNFNFIKEFWEIFKLDFRRFVDEFHVNGRFPKGSNASFLALIPKINHP